MRTTAQQVLVSFDAQTKTFSVFKKFTLCQIPPQKRSLTMKNIITYLESSFPLTQTD